MKAIEAARAAGWWFDPWTHWFTHDWYSADWNAIAAREHPWRWSGTARDLCLAHGIDAE